MLCHLVISYIAASTKNEVNSNTFETCIDEVLCLVWIYYN